MKTGSKLRRVFTPLLALLLLLGCVPEVDEPLSIHDLALYSNARDLNFLHAYIYGGPQKLSVAGNSLELREGESEDPFAVKNALLIDDAAYLSQPLKKVSPPPSRVQRVPLTTEVQLEVGDAVEQMVYFDGSRWFTLTDEVSKGFKATVIPKARLNGLVGVGNLNREEAEMLMSVLEPRGALSVTVMANSQLPPRQTDGFAEYLQTSLYVQQTLPTDIQAYNPPSRDLIWEVLAQGNQAVGIDQAEYIFIENESQLLTVWNQAYGSQLSPPPVPELNLDRETLVAIFMGQKPTGGFSLNVETVTLEQNDVYLDVIQQSPAEGAITTQALTSPWVIVRVLRGDVDAAWFRSAATGELFAVARKGQ